MLILGKSSDKKAQKALIIHAEQVLSSEFRKFLSGCRYLIPQCRTNRQSSLRLIFLCLLIFRHFFLLFQCIYLFIDLSVVDMQQCLWLGVVWLQLWFVGSVGSNQYYCFFYGGLAEDQENQVAIWNQNMDEFFNLNLGTEEMTVYSDCEPFELTANLELREVLVCNKAD